MVTFDSVLYNAAIILLPICLFEIFGNGYGPCSGDRKRSSGECLLVAAANVVTALFCAAHPIPLGGDSFDLRLIPFLLSFIYGSPLSGVAVAAAVLIYQYVAGPSQFIFMAAAYGFLTLICWVVSAKAGKTLFATRYFYPVLLTCLCFGALSGLSFALPRHLPAPSHSPIWLNFAFVLALHIALMLLIALIHTHIRANEVLTRKLIRSEKLNVLSELAAAVAHEIRNPMTVARGFMQLLSRSEVGEEKKRTYTQMVIEEIDRAEKIITDYLSFARPQAVHVEPLDLRDAVHKAMQLIGPYAAARGVELHSAAAQTPMPLLADEDRLVQGLVNVCKHGIDAMPEGGSLRLKFVSDPNFVVLEVSDEGAGMSEEVISRLGTPFYAMDTEGTGLSMMVAYRIVESLGGHVDVRSARGKGSTFTISLPRQRP
ncbi:ATP-binding protein [Gordoniibacillus kamchatkensis]|uniref:ATP-binding protein n=1 Tax=Gordoniibacillus kamchatkensis TaxID=1590651 RepID=UPI000698D403|nr:ATP-binding protein [Paenibacillus sp. VKM B-2647]